MPNLSKKEWVAVTAGIAFVVYIMFGQIVMNLFEKSTSGDMAAVGNAFNTDTAEENNNMKNQGVSVRDVVVGSGAVIAPGQAVSVNYVLKLADGTLIQDSKLVSGGQTFTFVYGAGQLIPGWEMGIEGMRVGGKRILTISPELGYGPQAVGPIPANSTLVFEIEVVAAESATE